MLFLLHGYSYMIIFLADPRHHFGVLHLDRSNHFIGVIECVGGGTTFGDSSDYGYLGE